ncbi:LOW QUALITY PROTEIN: hypothetical protein ACHAXA_011733, partial [Cyclostephanos tholiformis]
RGDKKLNPYLIMSYNGIGLSSVRGTATSGHVQHNAGHVRNSSRFHQAWRNANAGGGGGGGGRGGGYNNEPPPHNKLLTDEALRDGASSLAAHERKRQLEVRLLELRDRLEEDGRMRDGEIDEEVEWERRRTLDGWAREELEEEERRGRPLERQMQGRNIAPDGCDLEVEERGDVKLITESGEAKSDDVADGGGKVTDEKNTESAEEGTRTSKMVEMIDRGSDGGKTPLRTNGEGGVVTMDATTGAIPAETTIDDATIVEVDGPEAGGRGGNNAQAIKRLQDQRNDRLRDAFGISHENHREGAAFDREFQLARKMEKQKEKEMLERAKRKEERAQIRIKRREEKMKRREEGRDGGDDAGKRKRKTKASYDRESRRGRSTSTSSSSASSSSYSSSSYSSSSWSSRRSFSTSSNSSSPSYSSSSYSDYGRRRRGVKSSRRGRSRSSSRSRSDSGDKKSRARKNVDARRRRHSRSSSRSRRSTSNSRSTSPSHLGAVKGKKNVHGSSSAPPRSPSGSDGSDESRHRDTTTKAGARGGGGASTSSPPSPERTSNAAPVENGGDSCRMIPEEPSPSIPPAQSDGGCSISKKNPERGDKNHSLNGNRGIAHTTQEEGVIISGGRGGKSRWGDRLVSREEQSHRSPSPSRESKGKGKKLDRSSSPSDWSRGSSPDSSPDKKRKASQSRGVDHGRKEKSHRSPTPSRESKGKGKKLDRSLSPFDRSRGSSPDSSPDKKRKAYQSRGVDHGRKEKSHRSPSSSHESKGKGKKLDRSLSPFDRSRGSSPDSSRDKKRKAYQSRGVDHGRKEKSHRSPSSSRESKGKGKKLDRSLSPSDGSRGSSPESARDGKRKASQPRGVDRGRKENSHHSPSYARKSKGKEKKLDRSLSPSDGSRGSSPESARDGKRKTSQSRGVDRGRKEKYHRRSRSFSCTPCRSSSRSSYSSSSGCSSGSRSSFSSRERVQDNKKKQAQRKETEESSTQSRSPSESDNSSGRHHRKKRGRRKY